MSGFDNRWSHVERRRQFRFSFKHGGFKLQTWRVFCKHQLQGIANKQTTSEEVIVDVTDEEENEERSFEDLENDIADNDRGKAPEEGAKTTTRTRKRTTTQNQSKKRVQRSFHGLQRKQKIC